MGDTIIPVKAFVQNEEAGLAAFRSLLQWRSRLALDELFIHAELMIAAISMAEHLPRSQALHLAMLVGLAQDLVRFQEELMDLEKDAETNADRLAAGPLCKFPAWPPDRVAVR